MTLETLHDPVEAELHRELLEDAGIVVSTPGLEHRHMLGIAGSYVKISVQVRRSRLEEAQELLRGLEHADEILEPIEQPRPPAVDGPYRGGRPDPDEGYDDVRLKRIGAFASLVLTFGAGHFYARENAIAWVIAGLELVALGKSMLGDPTLAAIVPALILYDLFGGLRACERYNQRAPHTPKQQLLKVPLLLALAVASFYFFPWLGELLAEEAPALTDA